MAVRRLDCTTHRRFVDRIQRITVETERCWGGMSTAKMFAHLPRMNKFTLEDVEIDERNSFLPRYILGPIFFSELVPRPKGQGKGEPRTLAWAGPSRT